VIAGNQGSMLLFWKYFFSQKILAILTQNTYSNLRTKRIITFFPIFAEKQQKSVIITSTPEVTQLKIVVAFSSF
jgi:hypothetical protein